MPIFILLVFFFFSLPTVAQEASLEERLCAAVMGNELPRVRQLLDSGAAVNCSCRYSTLRKKLGAKIPVVSWFIRKKYRNISHNDPLTKIAILRENFELLKVLVQDYKANVNLPDASGHLPLYAAIGKRDLRSIDFLLTNGADLTREYYVYYAVENQLYPVLEKLLAAGASPHEQRGKSAIALAAAKNRMEMLKLLQEKEVSLLELDSRYGSVLANAVDHHNLPLVDACLAAGADINQTDKNHGTALKAALKNKDYAMLEKLLALQADPRISPRGRSPLEEAVYRNDKKALVLFFEKGYDLSGTKAKSIYLRPSTTDQAYLEYLIAHKFPFREIDLNDVIDYERYDLLVFLLEKGLDPNREGSFGYNAAGAAVREGDLESLKLLKKYAVNLNHQATFGDTPLHLAIKRKKWQIAEWLISQKVTLTLENSHHETPADYLKTYGAIAPESLYEALGVEKPTSAE